ncbi:MAG: amidohydrolase family protein [Nocardioidaceae bacterium]
MGGIDLHTHLAPHLDLDDGRPSPPALYDPAALDTWLDAHNLDGSAVSAPPPFYRQYLSADAAGDWVRSLNDGVLAAVGAHDRLVPLGYLPMEHPSVAVAEMERLIHIPELGGFTACAGGRSGALDADGLEPLWARLDEVELPVFLHPGQSPDRRLDRFYLANLLGNPYETAVAAAQLLLGDVLGRHPNLRIVLAHCGGAVPATLGRWERGIATNRPGLIELSRPLSEALRGIWVDCLAYEQGLVDLAIRRFGLDRVVLGSDWPFPMGLDDPVAAVQHLGADAVRQIGVKNVRSLVADAPAWRVLVSACERPR